MNKLKRQIILELKESPSGPDDNLRILTPTEDEHQLFSYLCASPMNLDGDSSGITSIVSEKKNFNSRNRISVYSSSNVKNMSDLKNLN